MKSQDMRTPLGRVLGYGSAKSGTKHFIEQRLTALEEKLVAAVRVAQSDDALFDMRQKLEKELSPYRGKMTADQIAMLERRYLDSALLERANMPRLSLFYLH